MSEVPGTGSEFADGALRGTRHKRAKPSPFNSCPAKILNAMAACVLRQTLPSKGCAEGFRLQRRELRSIAVNFWGGPRGAQAKASSFLRASGARVARSIAARCTDPSSTRAWGAGNYVVVQIDDDLCGVTPPVALRGAFTCRYDDCCRASAAMWRPRAPRPRSSAFSGETNDYPEFPGALHVRFAINPFDIVIDQHERNSTLDPQTGLSRGSGRMEALAL